MANRGKIPSEAEILQARKEAAEIVLLSGIDSRTFAARVKAWLDTHSGWSTMSPDRWVGVHALVSAGLDLHNGVMLAKSAR